MAGYDTSMVKELRASPILIQQLANTLPKDVTFKVYHLSTPPTTTSALYSAPPGLRPDRTYCESHFLSISIDIPSPKGANPVEVLVFAIEVLIYSTAYDSTFFVSKADSTGYLHLLNLPKGAQSPIRDISTTFLRHLLKHHERRNIRSIVSLFARAQDQYLFPGSIEHSGKHVLDDRGLVKWWCRVLDPLIENSTSVGSDGLQWDTVKGYLIVPGLDTHETHSSLPKLKTNLSNPHWTIGHPLRQISRYPDDIPRCMIPHFPDDPKARFLDELDEEIVKGKNSSDGRWKSVRSIEQFWDMMAFRQECSAGRLVGFIWIVFNPSISHDPRESIVGNSQATAFTVDSQESNTDISLDPRTISPSTSFNVSSQMTSPPKLSQETRVQSKQSPRSSKHRISKKKKLTGPVISRQPRVKTENKNYLLDKPENTAYYSWPLEGRGQIIVEESDYKRITELLLRLDFANLELASSSTQRWISEVRTGACDSMRDAWGESVTGTKAIEVHPETRASAINTLNLGLVRKKRKVDPKDLDETASVVQSDPSPQVNILTSGLVRKKAKN